MLRVKSFNKNHWKKFWWKLIFERISISFNKNGLIESWSKKSFFRILSWDESKYCHVVLLNGRLSQLSKYQLFLSIFFFFSISINHLIKIFFFGQRLKTDLPGLLDIDKRFENERKIFTFLTVDELEMPKVWSVLGEYRNEV